MSGPTLTINRETREVTLTRNPIGLQGPAGAGVPDGATDGQIAVFSESENDWVPTSVLSGCTQISVVDALPDPEVTGTLYLVKG